MGKISNDFRQFMAEQLGDLSVGLVDAIEETSPMVSVRLNLMKGGGDWDAGCETEVVKWCGEGRYLSRRLDFTLDPAMHQGRYYVQDASSMFIGRVVAELSSRLLADGPSRPLRYLDACAAPGGKTTAALAALPIGTLMVANEFDFKRAEILKENVIKWGVPYVVVSRGDTSRFRSLPRWFDIVAADVPCSGEGMMRKDDVACLQWSKALVGECARRQREIVANLWASLRVGGYMIYSTCTFNRIENEEVIKWISETLGGEPVELDISGFPEVASTGLMARFLPSRLRGEGLAIGVVRKMSDGSGNTVMGSCGQLCKKEKRGHEASALRGGKCRGGNLSAEYGCRLLDADRFDFMVKGDELRAIHKDCKAAAVELEQALDVIHSGISVGVVKGRDIVPCQALAMSLALNRKAFPEVEVGLETALSYLRREAPEGIEAPRGAVLLTWKGWPLGFVNHLGNRSNNLYPPAWRIHKRV